MLVPKPSRGPARPGSPAVLDIAVPSSCADELAVHVEARQLFLARGEVDLARGASFLAAVAALRIAASRSSGTFPHEVRVRRLRAALAAFDPAQRAHLVELMEAALEWEAAERLAAGLAPYGRRLRGWLTDVPTADGPRLGTIVAIGSHRAAAPGAVARYAEAAAAGDVDFALCAAIDIVGEIIRRLRRGEGVEVAFDALERAALSLCVHPASTPADRDDARRTLVILALTLRRRRPLVSAMLRRRLVLDRRRWAGETSAAGASVPRD